MLEAKNQTVRTAKTRPHQTASRKPLDICCAVRCDCADDTARGCIFGVALSERSTQQRTILRRDPRTTQNHQANRSSRNGLAVDLDSDLCLHHLGYNRR